MRRTLNTLAAVFGGMLGSALFAVVLAQPISNIIGTGDFRPLILQADGKKYFELTPAGIFQAVTGSGATVTLPTGTTLPSGVVFPTGAVTSAAISDGTIVSADMGTVWTTPAFSAGNFTAAGSMTWTVAEADVVNYQYIVEGKKLTLALALATTTIGGTPSDSLKIAVPAGKTVAKTTAAPAACYTGTAWEICILQVDATATTVTVYRANPGTNWATTTDGMILRGQIAFEIQ